eukprot:3419018-Rhodomonas_salina.1
MFLAAAVEAPMPNSLCTIEEEYMPVCGKRKRGCSKADTQALKMDTWAHTFIASPASCQHMAPREQPVVDAMQLD